MKAQEIRERFANYFIKNAHDKHASSPLIPLNDPTLLFANAGMNQFKDYFTGKAIPTNRRAVTIQKCVRAGGKHNDLENVGHTARHHTFFEMLGNFSFGDYFKKDAIRFAWEFLTVELKIDPKKLYVTVHYSDDEALNIWNKDIGLPLDRIFKKGDKDNFWEMGDVGPCGPCSEIYFDHGEAHTTPGFVPGPNEDILDDSTRYVEIWNLVFMQFEKTKEGKSPLPKPSIDTGAGLERIAAALQGKYWNYDTDLFEPILKEIEKLSGKKYSDPKYSAFMRVVADHIRSSTMLITDGVIPSNEGRGYVLRRIIRRAVRNMKELGISEVSFYKLVPSVFEVLGREYPQNAANISLAEKMLMLEEKKFAETLDTGLKFLSEAMEKEVVGGKLSGAVAFKLYDTFGFPLDLTEIILREKKLSVDQDSFEKCMKEQKEKSKKSWKGGVGTDLQVFWDLKNKYGETAFVGYQNESTQAKLLAVAELGENKGLVFERTPFYGESGGQMGDIGTVCMGNNILAHITDTQKPVENLFVHFSKDADALEVGQVYTLKVDEKRRALTKRNHSATHLLQAALVQVLGSHVKQAGSLVSSERLRFDFTHMLAVTKEELKRVEKIVNEQIAQDLSVVCQTMSKDDAIKKGATALFGEKYGDNVRVVQMENFSTELCGGTHVSRTGEIGHFSILSEASLSTGVRRIEALTSETSIERLNDRSENFAVIEAMLSLKDAKAVERIEIVLKEIKDKAKEIEALKERLQLAENKDLLNNPETLNGSAFKCAELAADADLKKLSDIFMDKYPEGIVFFYSVNGEKLSALLRVGKKHDKIHCGKLLNEALALVEGKGGGRPDLAQGSGKNQNVKVFVEKVRSLLA